MVGVRGRQKGRMWLMAGEGAGKMQGIGKYELQDLDEKKTYLRKDARLCSANKAEEMYKLKDLPRNSSERMQIMVSE